MFFSISWKYVSEAPRIVGVLLIKISRDKVWWSFFVVVSHGP